MTAVAEQVAAPSRRRWWRRLLVRRPAFGGLVGATLFYVMSQTPSLVPRHWLFQGVVSGIVVALGYGVGTLLSHVWRTFGWWEPPRRARAVAWMLLPALVVIAVAASTVQGVRWQWRLHDLMAMARPTAWGYAIGALIALLLAGALVVVARALRLLTQVVGDRLQHLARHLPPRAGRVASAVVVAALLIGLIDGIVIDALFSTADESFQLSDQLVEEITEPPATPLRSGSPSSLVEFDDLGRQGRAFVTGGIERTPEGRTLTTDPIRVFVGLESAETVEQRAQLVVEELERTEAFDRAVLTVAVSTGTGWVNPTAAAAIEQLWDGDTALASFQYSYLPSWVSFLVDSGRAREAGLELFNAVHERWAELPDDDRPLLLVYGESLGADGAEAAFSGTADIRNRTDGMLLVGPPNFSELWRTFTDRRDPGTPERLPSYDGGATVRFAAEALHLEEPVAPWYHPRVVYLQHASDPIVWWSPDLLFRRPAWLTEPRGDDVLPSMRWFPLVSFWQISADLLNDQAVPAGHGHDYGTLVVDAWAAIAAPDGWTAADTSALREHLADAFTP